MVKILIGMVVALAALLLLNYVIKKTDTYNWIVAVVGSIIALLSTGTIPFLVISQLNANRVARVGLVGALLLFRKQRCRYPEGILSEGNYLCLWHLGFRK